MKYLFKVIVFAFVLLSSIISANSEKKSIYLQELKAFKSSIDHENMFDKNMNSDVGDIFRKIEVNKKLGFFQRLVNNVFFNFNPVIATEQTMPALCGYVDKMCKKVGIPSPTIFITSDKEGLMNAAATKFIGSGGIIIGQDLIYSCTEDELEAVIAHEIGHIRYNHANKQRIIKLAIAGLAALAVKAIYNYAESKINCSEDPFITQQTLIKNEENLKKISEILYKRVAPLISILGIKMLIGKKHEKEADHFACDQGKATGLIAFFQRLIEIEKKEGKDLDKAYNALIDAKPQLSKMDSLNLWAGYYKAKGSYLMRKYFGKLRDVVYAPFDEHPNPSDRIKDAQDYLVKQV